MIINLNKQKLFFSSMHYKKNTSLTFFQYIKFIFIVSIITIGTLNLFFSSIAFAQSPSLSSLKENKCCVPILLAPMSIDDNGNLLISWADNRTGEIAPYIVASDNSGETFSGPLLLNISNTS